MLHFGDWNWRDYDYSLEVMEDRKEVSGRMEMRLGILSRVDTAAGHHWMAEIGSWTSSRNFDLLAVNPSDYPYKAPARRYMANRLPAYTHQWHAVQIRFRGEEIKIMLNEELIATSKHDKIPNGRVGVSSLNVGCVYWWRNPEVRDPDGKLLWKGWPDLSAAR